MIDCPCAINFQRLAQLQHGGRGILVQKVRPPAFSVHGMPPHLRRTANAQHDHPTRRGQANGVNGHGPSSLASSSANSRAFHNSHAYAISQQPLFTTWSLPDYLTHLEAMLPSNTPRPLEVRGSGVHTNGADDRTTERGVKVRWPSKRMSVGDMNKRVRSLVEWVGREQASAMDRSRRREAVEGALRDARTTGQDTDESAPTQSRVEGSTILGGSTSQSPKEIQTPAVNGHTSQSSASSIPLEGLGPGPGQTTMKMMEELMEELINFQERFGPGAKMKERERRTAAVAS